MTFNIKLMRAKNLSDLTPPFEVKFAGGWRAISGVEKADGKMILSNADGGLIAKFWPDTEIRVNFPVPEVDNA